MKILSSIGNQLIDIVTVLVAVFILVDITVLIVTVSIISLIILPPLLVLLLTFYTIEKLCHITL